LSESRAIITWVFGVEASYQWEVAHKHAQAYADRVGAKLCISHAYPDTEHLLLMKVKLIHEALEQFDRVLFVDSDVLFGPDSIDVFAETPTDAIGIREETFEGYPDAKNELTKRLGDMFAKAFIDRNPNQYPHYNSGVIVASKCHAHIFTLPTFDLPDYHTSEQDWVRYRIHTSEVKVHKFTKEQVGLWSTDNHVKFGRLKGIKHFAGMPKRDRQMAVDALRWSEGKPSGREAIVVGHFGIPGAVRFQIALNQRHLQVPMLVTDDWTWQATRGEEGRQDGNRRHNELMDACYWSGAHLRTVNQIARCKHAGGDLGAFYHGLIWAAENGIEYIMKLSMRAYIHGLDKYLQKTVDLMQKYGYHTGSHVCQYGDNKTYYLARSEIVIMHVPTWCKPEILTQLTPRPNVGVAEDIISDIIANNLTQHRLGPDWFGADRRKKYPNLLWHDNYYGPTPELDAKAAEEGNEHVRKIAATYNVDLGEEHHFRVSSFSRGYIGW